MSQLPVTSGQEAIRRFERLGYKKVRQNGSHIRLMPPPQSSRKPLSIPDHSELRKGLLRKLLRDAHISVEEFMKLKAR